MSDKILMNIFKEIPSLEGEVFQTLIENEKVKIERIVTRGQITPEGQWYDQKEDEFVLILEGSARILYEDGKDFILDKGDYLYIPAHKKHRVSWSDLAVTTLWLALFIK